MQPVEFPRGLLGVPPGERVQEFGVGVAPLRLLLAQVVDIGFLVMGVEVAVMERTNTTPGRIPPIRART